MLFIRWLLIVNNSEVQIYKIKALRITNQTWLYSFFLWSIIIFEINNNAQIFRAINSILATNIQPDND